MHAQPLEEWRRGDHDLAHDRGARHLDAPRARNELVSAIAEEEVPLRRRLAQQLRRLVVELRERGELGA